jgi:hypothetical protein
MAGIDTDTLCELAAVPQGTLAAWLNRGHFTAPPRIDGRRQWPLADALAVCLFASLLRRNRSTEAAAAEAVTMTQALGQLIGQMMAGRGQGAERLVFIVAEFPDGETWHRLATTDADLVTLATAILRRKPVHLELSDVTAMYLRTLAAFQAARAGQREREIA